MKLLLVLAAVAVAAEAASIEEQWLEFKINHGKAYKSLTDERQRFAIFQSNVLSIEEHNARFAKGEVSYSEGINQFTDMTQEEFQATLTSMPPKPIEVPRELFNDTGIVGNEQINWANKGLVTAVKNQGNCGSCWAFSAVGAIEGQVAKSGKPLVSLSAQNLVDCSRNINRGCNGGYMNYAFAYVAKNGVLTDAEYPYVARQNVCRKKGGQKISRFVDIPKNEASLLKALTFVGPISVALDAHRLSRYSSGIFDKSSGCISQINHAVLLVGAGSENGKDYWLLKNSWGRTWGMHGYFKLIRNRNACGINVMNSYPKL